MTKHEYYTYTKEELLNKGAKLPVIVMEDNAAVFQSMAEEMAEGFVNDLISKLRERGIDLRYCRSIWTGGGSILLWEYIRRSEKVGNTVFLDNLNANAAGYELAYREARESK